MHEHVYIVIPAKDEEKRIGKTLHQTLSLGYHNIVVVNDGSSDQTEQVGLSYGIKVLNHPINLGPGAATQTGIEYAIAQGAKVIVTMDADNQHFPSDIGKLVNELEQSGSDAVIGSRFLSSENSIPFHRRIYNKIGNAVTYVLTGLAVTDSQSGMKAFKADFAQKSPFNFNGYEFCTEFIKHLSLHKAKFTEVPIQVMYSKETLSKGQSLFSGFNMLIRLSKFF